MDKQLAHDKIKEVICVWVPGRATGEEGYTIAIIIAEALGGIEELGPDAIQVFATEIDDDALSVGRKGIYPQAAMNDILPDLLPRYFDLAKDTLTVTSKLRGYVMFSRHNVFQAPPVPADGFGEYSKCLDLLYQQAARACPHPHHLCA